MSEFDKEAEREKLREKYERDQEDRESTARMSDLLLKGATMTNAHCGTCGDPIFRHEGQEFCPSCQEVLTEGEQAETPDQQQADTPDQTSESGPETGGSEGAQPNATGGPTPTGDTQTDVSTASPTGRQEQPAPGQATSAQSETASDQPSPPTSESGTETHTQRSQEVTGESLADARASLTRTVTRLAQQAEASDDLERARAYLAATEEAADALAAVKQADR